MKTYNIHFLSFILSINGLLMGMESSSLTTFINSSQFKDYYSPLGTWEKGMVCSSSFLGSIVGALASGLFGDTIGLVVTLQISVLFSVFGTFLVLSLPSIAILCVARAIKGITYGLNASSIPSYISDTIPRSLQGYSLSVFHISSTVGSILMYYGGYVLIVNTETLLSFKVGWAVELVPSILLLFLNCYLPESPKWLGLQHRWQEASDTVDRMYHKVKNISMNDDEYVIQLYTAGTSIHSLPFSALFSKRFYKHTLVAMAVQILLQITMVGALSGYIMSFCESSSIDGPLTDILGGSLYLLMGLFTFVPLLLLDRTRRKDALIFGYGVLAISYTSMFVVIYQSLTNAVVSSIFRWRVEGIHASIVLATFALILSIYSGCLVSVSWLYTSEILPPTMRSRGYSLCVMVSGFISAVINLVLPTLVEIALYWVFLVLAIVCGLSLVLLIQLPETKNLSNRDVELLFGCNLKAPFYGFTEKNNMGLEVGSMAANSVQRAVVENQTDEFSPSVPDSLNTLPIHQSIIAPPPCHMSSEFAINDTSSYLSADWINVARMSQSCTVQHSESSTLEVRRKSPIYRFDTGESDMTEPFSNKRRKLATIMNHQVRPGNNPFRR